MDSIIDYLAESVQYFVPEHPWGRWGNDPLPIEIYYCKEADEPWSVRFVYAVVGDRRKWGRASGRDLETALKNARDAQYRLKRELRET